MTALRARDDSGNANYGSAGHDNVKHNHRNDDDRDDDEDADRGGLHEGFCPDAAAGTRHHRLANASGGST